MTLKGNLKDFSFIQLLNLINLANKSGGLYIERPGEIYRVIFRDGKMAFAEIGGSSSTLLSLLTESKLITPIQNHILREKLNGDIEKEIGIYLVNAGYVTQEQIFTTLENQLMVKMRNLIAWDEGFFRFEPGELVPEERIPVRMDLENLIVEGARKLHEIEELKTEIPSLEMSLKFTDRPGKDIRNINLSVEEWRVVSYVNPKNTIHQIAKTTKLNDLDIRRIVYALLQAGLVEIIRPGGLPLSLPGKVVIPVQNPEEQKSLIKRLISRIRSI